jgi:hypothetical protein
MENIEQALALFVEGFQAVHEISGYITHKDDVIMTNGTHYRVGTKKDDNGQYLHDHAKVFPSADEAKAFIDAGKPEDKKDPACESFIDMVLSKNMVGAESAFKVAMAEKVSSVLAARKIEIAQSLYARAQG